MQITQAQIDQYVQEGYFILESVIPENALEALRAECHRYIDIFEREMEAKGVTTDVRRRSEFYRPVGTTESGCPGWFATQGHGRRATTARSDDHGTYSERLGRLGRS